MEEPDDGGGAPSPVVFRAATISGADATPAKKEGIFKRSNNRKSTPKPLFKEGGRKRFSFSPSPELKQAFKKSAHLDTIEERSGESRNRRNLLSDLSEVADMVNVFPVSEIRTKPLEPPPVLPEVPPPSD